MITRLAIVVGWLAMVTPVTAADVSYRMLSFDALDRWAVDDHAAALDTFRNTCVDLKGEDWKSLCGLATSKIDARTFFERFFRPVEMRDGTPALFTGYYEPELDGSLVETDRYKYPVYAKPPEVNGRSRWFSRREIDETPVMKGRGLEIAWVDDPVELFFLQIQGSGRIRLPDGDVVRVGYAAANGHQYRSIGQELVRRGIYRSHQVSAQVIKRWVRRNPEQGRELLYHNPSYVFFREVSEVPADKGPLGAMNRSVTDMRSIAVDPAYVPLGAPVWVEKDGVYPLRRLMIAQDTGSAIKGAQRADIFVGTGIVAGRRAGRLKDPGRMVVLLPIPMAFALVPQGES